MKAILVFTGAVIFAATPVMVGGFAGFRPDQFPIPQENAPVQPAGYAFAIWGPIYLWLIIHSGFGLFVRHSDPGWDRTRWPLLVALVLGAVWIPAARLDVVIATVLLWGMLAGAAVALLRAPLADRWLLRAPLGLFAGWLTAAAAVALGLTGAGYGIFFGAVGWAVLALTIAVGLAIVILGQADGIPEFAAAAAWAFVGVVVANGTGRPVVAALALIGAAATVYAGYRSLRRTSRATP